MNGSASRIRQCGGERTTDEPLKVLSDQSKYDCTVEEDPGQKSVVSLIEGSVSSERMLELRCVIQIWGTGNMRKC